jgi:hypothetical protein
MAASGADSWDRVRQTFADQFEQDGTGFVYRRSQKGEAIRVSADERRKFIHEFDQNVRRAKWIISGGLTLTFGGLIGFSLFKGFDLSEAAIFVGIGLVMIPYFAYYRWAWAAPSRELGGRTPIAGERDRDEVRRSRFERMTYGQLAGAAFGGLMIPFIGSSRQDVFAGWNRLWLVFGGGLVLFAALQAFRKWRFEQENLFRSAMPRQTKPDITEPLEASATAPKKWYWRYLPLAVIVVGFAFVTYTPAGKQLAKQADLLADPDDCLRVLVLVYGRTRLLKGPDRASRTGVLQYLRAGDAAQAILGIHGMERRFRRLLPLARIHDEPRRHYATPTRSLL